MKIFMLAGTKDGRELAGAFRERGHEILLSTLTPYGASLVAEQGVKARFGALDEHQLEGLLKEGEFQVLVDATHPYAQNIQALAKGTCQALEIPYFRWQRPSSRSENTGVYWAKDIAEGAEQAAQLGRRILLTTGSHTLEQWVKCSCLQDKELFIRVLPTHQVLKHCEDLGFKPFQIIAAQGPFSQEFNEVVLRDFKIEVLIAKESGQEGGTPAKIEACRNLDIPVILIERPRQFHETLSFVEFIRKVEEDANRNHYFRTWKSKEGSE